MAMASQVVGAVSGTGADVNADRELKTALTQDVDKAGFAVLAGESHDGVVGNPRLIRPGEVSHDHRLRSGIDTVLFSHAPGIANPFSADIYRFNNSTIAAASVNGLLYLNSSNSVAGGAYARFTTYQTFGTRPATPMYIDVPFGVTAAPPANQVFRIGKFSQNNAVTAADATDGAYFEKTGSNVWQGCLMNATSGGAAATVALTGFTPVPNKVHMGLIVQSLYSVDFYIDGILYGSIARPTLVGDIEAFSGNPLTAWVDNVAAAGSACQYFIGKWGVTRGDVQCDLTPEILIAMSGGNAISAQGVAGATISNIVNSTAPTSGTLSNTAAAYTTVDGAFQWAAVAGAETDYILFGYQVPAPSATSPSKSLSVTGAKISLFNNGAANSATVPTTVQFFYACGATAVSLATTDNTSGTGAKAARRLYCGQAMIPVSAVIGQAANGEINVQFPPMITPPGMFSVIIARIVSGAATASQIIRGQAALDKQWID